MSYEFWQAMGAKYIRRIRNVLTSDQAYFWTEDWQSAERSAEADIAADRVRDFNDVRAFIRWLDSSD